MAMRGSEFLFISAVLILLTYIVSNGPAIAGTINFRGTIQPKGKVLTVKVLCDFKESSPEDAQLSLTIRKRTKDGRVVLSKIRKEGKQSEESPQEGAELATKDATDNDTVIPKGIALEGEKLETGGDESGVYYCIVRTKVANYTAKLFMMIV